MGQWMGVNYKEAPRETCGKTEILKLQRMIYFQEKNFMVLTLYLRREARNILPLNKIVLCMKHIHTNTFSACLFRTIIFWNLFLNQIDLLKRKEDACSPIFVTGVFLSICLMCSWVITAHCFLAYLQWWGQTCLELWLTLMKWFYQEKQVTVRW